MPQLIGDELYDAIEALQAAGVYVPANIGYFGTFPISVIWQKFAKPGGTVLTQVPTSGAQIAANAAVVLTVSAYPLSVAFP